MTRSKILFAALALAALAAPAFAQEVPLRADNNAGAGVLHAGDQDQDNADALRKSDPDVSFAIRPSDPNARLSPDYSASHAPAAMPQDGGAAPVSAAPAATAAANATTADLNRQQAAQSNTPVQPPAVAASGPPQSLSSQPDAPPPPPLQRQQPQQAVAYAPPHMAPAAPTQEPPETVIVRAPPKPGYLLATGDKVRVTVFGEDDLSGEFQLDGNGFISLPLIGQVHASGLTTDQLAGAITNDLREGYLNQPRVSVAISTYRPFYIIGQVNKPGEYPYVNDMTVLNAVAMGGGYTDAANETTVYVRGKDESDEHAVIADSTTQIHPGDVVRVQKSTFWAVAQAMAPLGNFAGLAYIFTH
ncbi:MAG TPA: polysaccharide biosynthesis/export family protein [Rhizomicrobium sp.]|jgi:polysaccharide export outer membrane protein|nr:polysaccharide biosynthesis/export family protein [Rhizomicrobium sp.]